MKKMYNKKGFTLIELLAVILILGIIALIAIPTVNTIINDSKKQAFLVTGKLIADTVSDKCNINAMKGQNDSGTYSIQNGEILYDINLKGKMPDSGTININSECEVEMVSYQEQMCSYKGYSDDSFTAGEVTDGICQINETPINMEVLPNNSSYFIFDVSTGTITDYDIDNPSCQGAVVIPEKIDGVNVKKIGKTAFVDNYKYIIAENMEYGYDLYENIIKTPLVINSVYVLTDLPDLSKTCYVDYEETASSVVEFDYVMSDGEFDHCEINSLETDYLKNRPSSAKITSVDFSKAIYLETIDLLAFAYNSISNITFNNNSSLSRIEIGAFKRNLISKIDFSNLSILDYIGASSFENNVIDNVKFNEIVSYIGSAAFKDNRIESLEIPSTIDSLRMQTFAFNNIQNLVIPDTVEIIWDYAFYQNPNMKSVVLGTSIYGIGTSAFRYCGLDTVTNNSTALETIKYYAFANNNLKTISFPSINYIYQYAFDMNSLETVYIPSNIIGIQTLAFRNNPTLTSITINSAYSANAKWGAPNTCQVIHTN